MSVYLKPAVLAQMPAGKHGIIEASAGTGKTYTIEHLVVELLLQGRARIDNILVVTFTERAALELGRRIRTQIERLVELSVPEEGATPHSARGWNLDSRARACLEQALGDFEGAAISTIHAFCQRILTEHAFLHGRLLEQQLVDQQTVFSHTFQERVRSEFARNPDDAAHLSAWLAAGRTLRGLEALLFECYPSRRSVRPVFHPEVLHRAIVDFVAVADRDRTADLARMGLHASTARAVESRLAVLCEIGRSYLEHASLPRFLAELSLHEQNHHGKLQNYLVRALSLARSSRPSDGLAAQLAALLDAAPSLEAVMVQRFLPRLGERIREVKRAQGQYDFDDMLLGVAQSLAGPRGRQLITHLRQRYHYALIDEFQDTDPLQWALFRRIFFGTGGEHVLIGVGDPKQSIYGFRGADLNTYWAARSEIVAAGGTVLALDRTFRSTPRLAEAQNRLLDPAGENPFFAGVTRYDHPLHAAEEVRHADLEGAPIHLFVDAQERPWRREARLRLAHHIGSEVRRLLESDPSLRPSQIFVLTRTTDEGYEMGTALAQAGIPHTYFKQDGLCQSRQAEDISDLLWALAEPTRKTRRLKAFLTPFFGVSLAELASYADLPETHPLACKLRAWAELAHAGSYATLFARVMDQSGIAARELIENESRRGLINYHHLFELLGEIAAERSLAVADLAATLDAWMTNQGRPAAVDANVERSEPGEAVGIMTIHKAKGLEASVVFVYGGLSSGPGKATQAYEQGDERLLYVGKPPESLGQIIADREDEENRRLLYVALTRASQRLYVPYFPKLERTCFYQPLNDQIRRLLSDPKRPLGQPWFAMTELGETSRAEAPRIAALSSWRPPPAPPKRSRQATFEALRRRNAGPQVASYSRFKQSTWHPSEGTAARLRTQTPPGGLELPGGPVWGLVLHELLERVPLETFLDRPPLEVWQELSPVRRLFARTLDQYGQDPSYLPLCRGLVYRALTTPLEHEGGTLDTLAQADRVEREVEFIFRGSTEDVEFVRGFLDVVFVHAGRTFLLDWKSDALPAWSQDTVAEQVSQRYLLQARLYLLATAKMLGATDATSYQERIGGFYYCFLRGLEHGFAASILHLRPSWSDICRSEQDLLAGS